MALTEEWLYPEAELFHPSHVLPVNFGQIANEEGVLAMCVTLIHVNVSYSCLEVINERSRVDLRQV